MPGIIGADGRTRTADLLITNQLLKRVGCFGTVLVGRGGQGAAASWEGRRSWLTRALRSGSRESSRGEFTAEPAPLATPGQRHDPAQGWIAEGESLSGELLHDDADHALVENQQC